MSRPILVLGALAVLCVVSTYSQHYIYPTYRPPPPPKYPIIRTARAVTDCPRHPRSVDAPAGMGSSYTSWPSTTKKPLIYDDIKIDPNRRYARSLSAPGEAVREEHGKKPFDERKWHRPVVYLDGERRKTRSLGTPKSGRPSGSSSRGSGGHATGATHPGYNRRNTREVRDENDQLAPSRSTIEYKLTPSLYGGEDVDSSVSHDGSKYRNTRSLRSQFPTLIPPFNPEPRFPIPITDRPRFPTYA